MAILRSRERPIAQQAAPAEDNRRRVLAVIDGSERAGRVVEHALSLAHDDAACEIVLLGIVPEPPDGRLRGYGSFKREEVHARLKDVFAERALLAAARRLDHAGVSHIELLEVGDPADTILRVAADKGCDLVLVGDAPANALQRWLPKVIGLSLPTVASQVAQLAAVPVVVVK